MRLEKEYRLIYGIWQYVEMILHELGATLEEVRESGSEESRMVKIYEARLPDATLRAEVLYERKHLPPFPKYFKKLAATNVKIDVTAGSTEREREIIDYISRRLGHYTLRSAG